MKFFNFLNNIRIRTKMGIIGVLATIGLILPTYFYVSISSSLLSATEHELQGLDKIESVVLLMKVVAEHRGTSARMYGGDTSASAELAKKTNEVDKMLDTVGDLLEKNEVSAVLTTDFSRVLSKWSSLKGNIRSRSIDGAKSFEIHSEVIEDAGLFIIHLGNEYELSYDSNAATHHVIVANFHNLPRLTDVLGKIRGLGSGILARGSITPQEYAKIEGLISALRYPYFDFVNNMETGAEVDPDFAQFGRAANQIDESIQLLVQSTRDNLLRVEELTYSPSNFFEETSAIINDIYRINELSVKQLRETMETKAQASIRAQYSTIAVIMVILVVGLLLGFILVRSINSSVNSMVRSFKKISHGDYDVQLDTKRRDELGVMATELTTLVNQLSESSILAREAHKVKQALDNSSTCFMMADKDRNIVYMNESVIKMLREAESDIQAQLPGFAVDHLMGGNIDSFHKNPAHQRAILNSLSSSYQSTISVGNRKFRLIVNPIYDENKEALGNSVEWHDMTEIFENERRTTRILESLNCTSTNVMIADSERTIIYCNRAVMSMFEECESDIRKVMPHFSVDKILNNKIDVFHKNPAHQEQMLDKLTLPHVAEIQVGTRHFKLVANPIFTPEGERIGTVLEWLDRTSEVAAEFEIGELVDAALQGDFTKRSNINTKKGFMLKIAEGLNQLLEVTENGLDDVSKVLMALSEGDLTKRIDNDYMGTFDELKNYTNTTSSTLSEMIGEIREASETIYSASTEIARGNADLSSRTEQQASSLEETASSMEEITGTVRLNAENANQANGLASQASSVAKNGGELIEQVVTTMASINESSQKIADIIGVIDGIAFQTNILALNAAVEAARAGEQGRGFAVVASEVRTLAQRSANAAKDIKDLISDSVSKIENGNSLVNQSGETMQEIVTAIQRVNDIMSEIAAASAEQASGIDEVGKAVTQMDEMTQQNAALVEESAASAEKMSQQAEQLSGRVRSFKLDENGQDDAPARSKPTPQLSAPEPSSSPQGKIMPPPSGDDEWESF